MQSLAFLVFAKAPQPGTVKTRMTPPLTAEQAARFHEHCMAAVVENANRAGQTWANAGGRAAIVIVGTPDDSLGDFEYLAPASRRSGGLFHLWPQGPGDLGERLDRAMHRAHEEGWQRLCFLGADSPTLTPRHFTAMHDALDSHDAAVGPCDDGGYYLLAVNRPLPTLLERIEWGSDRVLAQTRERAAHSDIRLALLEPWYDLDRFEDLPRAARDLANEPQAAALRTWIEDLICEHTP